MIFRPRSLSTLIEQLVNKSLIASLLQHYFRKISLLCARTPALSPSCCELCRAGGEYFLCKDCLENLTARSQQCELCSLTLASTASGLCPECQKNPPNYDQCIAPCDYTFPASHLVHEMKYKGKQYIAKVIAYVMTDRIHYSKDSRPELLIPIPIEKQRKRSRGFNQGELIARYCSNTTGIPVNTEILKIKKNSGSQVGSTRSDRFAAMKGSMHCTLGSLGKVSHVVLIDDVMTTGATVQEATRALKKAGVKKVEVWVFARTPKPEFVA